MKTSPPWNRRAEISRETSETTITVALGLDGEGRADIATGIGFLDHMLIALARHGLFDLKVQAKGDLHIDFHHTTEDVGIVIGQCLRQALGDKRGIRRYGAAVIPMDEALAEAAVDISGRPFLAWSVTFNAGITLHVTQKAGTNAHHVAEACFKALARALREAVEPDPRAIGAIPSTKGVLEA